MKKLFLSFFLFWTIFVHAGYNYHWAVEQKFTTRSSINQITNLNKLIAKCKSDGNWGLLDALWIMATETQQQAVWNLVNPGSNTLTEVNSPAWVANQGYTSNGTTSYLNTNFNPATQGVNFIQNSASMHIYLRSNISEGRTDMGSYNSTSTVRTHLLIRYSADLMYGSLNTTAASTKAVTDSRGFFSTQRTASNLTTYYRNGSSLGTVADVSAAVESLNGFICALNSSGAAAQYSNKQLSIAAYGGGTITNSTFNSAIEAYMDFLGTGVE